MGLCDFIGCQNLHGLLYVVYFEGMSVSHGVEASCMGIIGVLSYMPMQILGLVSTTI